MIEHQKAIQDWLETCSCENLKGHTENSSPKRLFLRPAINQELKSDVRWLKELADSTGDVGTFVAKLRDYIFYHKHEYGRGTERSPMGAPLPEHPPWPSFGPMYFPYGPVLCLDCATKLGLVEAADWGLVTLPELRCEKCSSLWDPLDDLVPGAYLIPYPEKKKDHWCITCCLQHSVGLKDALADKRKEQMSATLAKTKADTSKGAINMQDRRKQHRQANDKYLEDLLTDSVCAECGEDWPARLTLVPGKSTPPGTISAWRRDNSPDLFRNKIATMIVKCKSCVGLPD